MILSSFKKILAKAGVLLISFLPSAKADGNKADGNKADGNRTDGNRTDCFSVLARVDISAVIIGIES